VSASEVARKFAAAVAAKDEAAARSCVAQWQPDRDGPAKLYTSLAGAPVGLEAVGDARTGEAGRAAQELAIVEGGKHVDQLWLLGEGEPFKATGVATKEPHLARFLAGEAPARIAWDTLEPDPAATAAVKALVAALDKSAGGSMDAAKQLGVAMSDDDGTATVGYIAAAYSRGAKLEIVDARGLGKLGRGVVETRLVGDPQGTNGGEPERVFLYLDHGTPVRWRKWLPYFNGDALVAK
jgi:hypothetical protein